MSILEISRNGVNLIKRFESCVLHTYADQKGVLTIGWGHTGPDVLPDMLITQGVADALLLRDLKTAENAVNGAITTDITQNQFDACCSLAYNTGSGHFQGSTLVREFNAGNIMGAADQFLVWCLVAGHKNDGLLERRRAERELFLSN